MRAGKLAIGRLGQCSFTLTEMLLVVAIVLLLAALLLPALGPARDRGYRASCANNLRQWGAEAMVYSGDSSGKLPGAVSSLNSHSLYSEDVGLNGSFPPTVYYPPFNKMFVAMMQYCSAKNMFCPAYTPTAIDYFGWAIRNKKFGWTASDPYMTSPTIYLYGTGYEIYMGRGDANGGAIGQGSFCQYDGTCSIHVPSVSKATASKVLIMDRAYELWPNDDIYNVGGYGLGPLSNHLWRGKPLVGAVGLAAGENALMGDLSVRWLNLTGPVLSYHGDFYGDDPVSSPFP